MIIIMGAVGSGKSEQTTRLSKRLEIPRISTSTILREHLTPEREAKMLAGDLIDDTEIIQLLEPVLDKIKAKTNEFLLDGFPRSVPQAEWLSAKIKSGEVKFTALIKLNVSGDVVLARMLNRGRQDDKKEIILHRLSDYQKITTPVVDYLRSRGLAVNEINGEAPADKVEAEIKKVLDSK